MKSFHDLSSSNSSSAAAASTAGSSYESTSDFFGSLRALQPDQEVNNQLCPYLLCNETHQEEALSQIEAYARMLPSPGGIHIGFSSWFNFDLLSVTPSTYALILDIDPKVYFFHQKLENAIVNSSNPQTFIKKLMESFNKEEETILPFPKDYMEALLALELQKKHGYLSSQDAFNRVRTMCREKRIFFGCADITDANQMSEIASWCKNRKLHVDTLYISNISEWIIRGRNMAVLDTMIANLKTLKSENTLIVDAFYLENYGKNSGPPLRVNREIPEFTPPKLSNRRSQASQASQASGMFATRGPLKF